MFRAIKNARRMFLRNWLLVGIFSAATGFIVYQMINKLFIFLSSGNTTNFFTATRENQNDALIYFILFLFPSLFISKPPLDPKGQYGNENKHGGVNICQTGGVDV